jgi:hypothetical protein
MLASIKVFRLAHSANASTADPDENPVMGLRESNP